MNTCPVCEQKLLRAKPALVMDCARCGQYSIAPEALQELRRLKLRPALVSGWISHQNRSGTTPIVDVQLVHRTLTVHQLPPFKRRVEDYLSSVVKSLQSLSDEFNPLAPEFISASYCWQTNELNTIINWLKSKGYIDIKGNGRGQITAEGYFYADELTSSRAQTSQGFIAMHFGENLDTALREGFYKAIKDAGYEPLRIDRKEHINDISDEIVMEIRRSRFLVADLTGGRSGVYFEAGLATGLGKPVFYTCARTELPDVHFDIRQINCIDWADPSDLQIRLALRIQAVIGPGPGKSN